MASASSPITKSLVNEGGYAPAFDVNGETYKGIDRLQHPEWPGWKIIDDYKIQHGGIRQYAIIKSAPLDSLVLDFYTKNFWPKSKAALLESQVFAENYFDFYFHKPAIAVAALQAAAGQSNLIDAIKVANLHPEMVYSKFYNLRIQHYSNNWMNGSGKNRIYYKPGKGGTQATQLRRAKSYPATLGLTKMVFPTSFLNYNW